MLSALLARTRHQFRRRAGALPALDAVVGGGNFGVSTTWTAVPETVPSTVITPLAAPTVRPVAYWVAWKLFAQLLRFDAPADCTISVTQVRAPLAANTISEAFARLV